MHYIQTTTKQTEGWVAILIPDLKTNMMALAASTTETLCRIQQAVSCHYYSKLFSPE